MRENMKNPREIHLEVTTDNLPDDGVIALLVTSKIPEGDTPNAFACTVCGKVWAKAEWVADCCKQYFCQVCGKKTRKFYNECDEHRRIRQLLTAPRIDKETYEGYVFSEEHGGGDEDSYYPTLQDFLEYCYDEGIEPVYVYTCEPNKWQGVDVDRVLESLEDHYDDASSDVVAEQELRDFATQWNAKQNIVTYHYINSVIVLDEEKFQAMLYEAIKAK
jgi:hypothetical protein